MYYDWLKVEQVFNYDLPIISDTAYQKIHIETGEGSCLTQPFITHRGSFCDSLIIRISGRRLVVEGNPSRWGRLDNVIGISSLDEAFNVFNRVIEPLGLPSFTKCTSRNHLQSKDGSKSSVVSDGAVIKRIDLCSNFSASADPEHVLRALSIHRVANSIPRLFTNGATVDWLSPRGNAFSMYRKAYDKAFELALHSKKKIKDSFGIDSKEFSYINKLIEFCDSQNVVRLEQSIKSRYLKKHDLCYWGLFEENELRNIHQDFISILDKTEVPEMSITSIADKLISNGVVNTYQAANVTASYAYQWMHGKRFDLSKSAVKTHRARLRKINIDIAQEFDSTCYQPITVERKAPIILSSLQMPRWYVKPEHAVIRAA